LFFFLFVCLVRLVLVLLFVLFVLLVLVLVLSVVVLLLLVLVFVLVLLFVLLVLVFLVLVLLVLLPVLLPVLFLFVLFVLLVLVLLLLWRYNSERVFTLSTIPFHIRRSCNCSAHFTSFVFFRSFLTSSSHRDLGLPVGLPVNGFHFCIIFTQHCHYVPSPHINRVLSYPFTSPRLSSYYQPLIP